MKRLCILLVLAVLSVCAGAALPAQAQGPVGVTAISPAQGLPGDRLEVRIRGWGFASADTVWVAAEDLGVDSASLQVLADDLLSVPLHIPENAPPGARSITVWGNFGPNETFSDTLDAAFLVQLPDLGIKSISPASAYIGTEVQVSLTGYGFQQFPQGVRVEIGGLTAAQGRILSDAQIAADIFIPIDASPGAYTVRVVGLFNGQEAPAELPGGFRVEAPPDIALDALEPGAAYAGSVVTLRAYGAGFTTLDDLSFAIDGLGFQAVRVVSDGELAAEVSIPPQFPPGWYAASVQGYYAPGYATGAELARALRIWPALAFNSMYPMSALPGSRAELLLYGENFQTFERLELRVGDFPAGEALARSDRQAAATLTIPRNAAPGRYPVTLTGYNPGLPPLERTLPQRFEVLPLPAEATNTPGGATPTPERAPGPTTPPPPPPEEAPPDFGVHILENVSGRPGDTVLVSVYGRGFRAPRRIEADIRGLEVKVLSVRSDDELLLRVYIPEDAQPGWRTLTLTAYYGAGGIRQVQVAQSFQVLRAIPEFSLSREDLLFGGALAALGALASRSALRAWRRKRWQKQATSEALPRRCRRGERRVQRGAPELQPGRWKVAAVRATMFTKGAAPGSRTVHTMPAAMLKDLDKAARARLLHGDTPELAAQVREMARQFAGLVLTWQITSRTGKDVLLETRLEGGEAEVPFTFYQCTGNKWRQRARWKAKCTVVDHLPHVIRAPLREETSAAYSAYINREVHAYLKNVVAEAGRLL